MQLCFLEFFVGDFLINKCSIWSGITQAILKFKSLILLIITNDEYCGDEFQ